MKQLLLTVVFLSAPFLLFSQQNDSITTPILTIDNKKIVEHITIGFDVRTEFQGYTFRGEDLNYNGVQFKNGYTALRISGKFHEKINYNFRNRFNRTSDLQSLDQLASNIELAYMNIKASPTLDLFIGKMPAFYGGYEYEFSPMNVLEYNDIYNNVLAFVTGAGVTYKASANNQFGMQVLNSRTLLYEDLYGEVAAENIEEPIWPVAIVGNWRGSFFEGKLKTIYSLSYSNEVKNRGTYFFTLGHKYQNKNLTVMYDFQYSYEQIDTKGIINNLLDENQIAEDVLYIENWLRAEYDFNSRFKGLVTLMTNTAYDNFKTSKNQVRTSYGVIPTLYYSPFKNLDLRLFFSYIGRYFDYSNYAKQNFNVSSYNKNEARIGIIAPVDLL